MAGPQHYVLNIDPCKMPAVKNRSQRDCIPAASAADFENITGWDQAGILSQSSRDNLSLSLESATSNLSAQTVRPDTNGILWQMTEARDTTQ